MEPQPEVSPPMTSPPATSSTDIYYAAFHAHPFTTDSEWQSGLASILGHPDTPATQAELDANPGLILNAKLFYFSRKHHLPPIDAAGYVDWLRQQTQGPRPSNENTGALGSEPTHIAAQPLGAPSTQTPSSTAGPQPPAGPSQEPPYPTSFAAIIDLITTNKPIPGIEEIPDTVLEPGSSKIDSTPRRRKPWEKGGAADTNTDTNPLSINANPVPRHSETTNNVRTSRSQVEEEQGDAPSSAAATAAATTTMTIANGNAGTSATNESSMGTLSNSASENGPLVTGEGVVKILQPNAIPPSGLLSAATD